MIARVWRGSTRPEDADRYLAHLNGIVVPQLTSIDGYRGVQVLRRLHEGRAEFVVITFWESMDAIRRFTGPNVEAAVVTPDAQLLLTAYDRHVTHYENLMLDFV